MAGIGIPNLFFLLVAILVIWQFYNRRNSH